PSTYSLSLHDALLILHYISGGSGLLDIFTMNQSMQAHFFTEFQSLLTKYDYILFDMGAGASKESLFFIMATDECIVVSTPEPTRSEEHTSELQSRFDL